MKLATDQGSDNVHVLVNLYNGTTAATKVLLKTLTDAGELKYPRELVTPASFFPTEAIVTGSVIHFQGYDGAVVTYDADTSGGPVTRTVLQDPCPGDVNHAAFFFDKTNQHMAAQCRNGGVFVDGSSTPNFTASYGLRSFVIVGGTQFLALDDANGTGYGELRYSPNFDPQGVDFGLHGLSLNLLYASTNSGEVAMFSASASSDLSDGNFRWGTFAAATPPTESSLPALPIVATLADGYFEPGHAGSEHGRVTMASASQDKSSVHMSQFKLDGSLRIWNYEVASLSQGIVRSVDAGEMGAITSAIAWSGEVDNSGTLERWVDVQVVSCTVSQ